MKIQINKNRLKIALYFYTFVIVAAAIMTAFSIVSNPDRTALAVACNVDACVQAEIGACDQYKNDPAMNQACVSNAYNRCMAPQADHNNLTKCEVYFGTSNNGGGNEPGTTTDPLPYPYETLYCLKPGTTTAVTGLNCSVDVFAACTSWNVYECVESNACYTFTDGCPNGKTRARNLEDPDNSGIITTSEARSMVDAAAACTVRQADCNNIGGIYMSKVNCDDNCAIANPPVPQNPQTPPPPTSSVQVSCNETCNGTDRLCPGNLSCTNVDGVNRCRLPSNPTSATCEPPQPVTVQCNDTCNNVDRLCPSGLTCTTVDNENRCRLPANLSSAQCLPLDVPPNYTIEKVVEGNQGPFNIGDLVTFRIRITNTGQTTLTNVRFRDVYNSNYLTYVGGSATKSSGGSISDINPVLTFRINGEIQIANVAASNVLGSLAPSNYYEFTLRFITKAPINNTCNVGYALTPNLPEISDDACISSRNIDTDI